MPVVLVHYGPSLAHEQYDQVIQKMTAKSGIESLSDWPVEGLLVHDAGQGGNGFRVFDVWESEEACRRFGEHLQPLLEQVGIDVTPELCPVHAFVSAGGRCREGGRPPVSTPECRSRDSTDLRRAVAVAPGALRRRA